MKQKILIYFIVCLIISIPTLATNNLDFKEANVISVKFQKLTGDEYNFDVTLHHDDDGEDGYADKWQVENLIGNVLGTRILTHGHGTVEFTRSHRFSISDEINTVVVRGYDQTHGFGGQVIILSLMNSSIVILDQGENPLNFSSFVFNDYPNVSNTTSSLIIDNLSTTSDKLDDTETDGINFNFGLSVISMISVTLIFHRRSYEH